MMICMILERWNKVSVDCGPMSLSVEVRGDGTKDYVGKCVGGTDVVGGAVRCGCVSELGWDCTALFGTTVVRTAVMRAVMLRVSMMGTFMVTASVGWYL